MCFLFPAAGWSSLVCLSGHKSVKHRVGFHCLCCNLWLIIHLTICSNVSTCIKIGCRFSITLKIYGSPTCSSMREIVFPKTPDRTHRAGWMWVCCLCASTGWNVRCHLQASCLRHRCCVLDHFGEKKRMVANKRRQETTRTKGTRGWEWHDIYLNVVSPHVQPHRWWGDGGGFWG